LKQNIFIVRGLRDCCVKTAGVEVTHPLGKGEGKKWGVGTIQNQERNENSPGKRPSNIREKFLKIMG